jgi:lysylphosphatidylglycerol synthetase-like protein (DUF2156 family)
LKLLKQSFSVRLTLALILINAVTWLAFGGILAADAHPALSVPLLVKVIMAFLSFTVAAVLVSLFVFLGRQSRVAYLLTLLLFILTILITFFDDIGWADIFFLLLNIVPFLLLIKDRRWYLGKARQIIEN